MVDSAYGYKMRRPFVPTMPVDHNVFDKLNAPSYDQADCIFQLSTFLEPGLRPAGKSSDVREFEILRMNIQMFKERPNSNNDKFFFELLVAVNGGLGKEEHINFLRKINDTKTDRMRITVFQRENIGWHWGAFWDVWSTRKHVDCHWWATMEADVMIGPDDWFDVCNYMVRHSPYGDKTCYVGDTRGLRSNPDHWPGDTWVGTDRKPMQVTSEQLMHTNGGFYFCPRNFLEDMDSTFGHFTYAKGAEKWIDGIGHGELGFAQKAHAMGYEFIPTAHLVHTPAYKVNIRKDTEGWLRLKNWSQTI